MALYTLEAVQANLRNRDGRRVFCLGEGDRLTPGARDFLQREHIELVSPEKLKHPFVTLRGAAFSHKPEDMTHLNGDVLVEKTHPRIDLRGKMDTLQACLLLAQRTAVKEGYRQTGAALGEALDCSRRLLSAEVLDEPVKPMTLGGLTPQELRSHSQNPGKYYGQPHFMPEAGDSDTLLWVNLCRTAVRQAELAACKAFQDGEGRCIRTDLVEALNRMSSFLWILEIRLRAGKEGAHGS